MEGEQEFSLTEIEGVSPFEEELKRQVERAFPSREVTLPNGETVQVPEVSLQAERLDVFLLLRNYRWQKEVKKLGNLQSEEEREMIEVLANGKPFPRLPEIAVGFCLLAGKTYGSPDQRRPPMVSLDLGYYFPGTPDVEISNQLVAALQQIEMGRVSYGRSQLSLLYGAIVEGYRFVEDPDWRKFKEEHKIKTPFYEPPLKELERLAYETLRKREEEGKILRGGSGWFRRTAFYLRTTIELPSEEILANAGRFVTPATPESEVLQQLRKLYETRKEVNSDFPGLKRLERCIKATEEFLREIAKEEGN